MKIIDIQYPKEPLEINPIFLKVAQDYLDEDELKEYLLKWIQFLGFCGSADSPNPKVQQMLDASYDIELEEHGGNNFIDAYYQNLLRKEQQKLPLEDKLKVMHAYTKEEQLENWREHNGY